ncbi:MAG TPA: hypothetical protein VNA69_12685 [Thermoanaerobaculia bacterium]|nr:hypothetical protein [Thermoanaerobaculia bacterium]
MPIANPVAARWDAMVRAVDRELRARLEAFLKPFYQDIDGVSRFDDVERIARIARRLYAPPDDRAFELLLLFHRLGRWLEKMGNLSRTLLAVGGLGESELLATAASIRRIDDPVTDAERAIAAAVMIDSAGVRGLTEQFARARREGNSLMDVVRAAMSDVAAPEWLSPQAVEWLHVRREARREVCRKLFEESSLDDLA